MTDKAVQRAAGYLRIVTTGVNKPPAFDLTGQHLLQHPPAADLPVR